MDLTRKPISKELRNKVYNKYDKHCAYCGCKLELKDMQVDHLECVRNHGENTDIENLMPACRSCNFYKSTMTLEKFREQLGKLLTRLDKTFIYRLAKKYRLITENNIEIRFFYETYEGDNT